MQPPDKASLNFIIITSKKLAQTSAPLGNDRLFNSYLSYLLLLNRLEPMSVKSLFIKKGYSLIRKDKIDKETTRNI